MPSEQKKSLKAKTSFCLKGDAECTTKKGKKRAIESKDNLKRNANEAKNATGAQAIRPL
jgi:hypothetical protein